MLFRLLLALLIVSVTAEEKEGALHRLGDVSAAESFIDSSEVVVVGFFEGEDSFGYKEFVTAVSELRDVPVAMCHEKEVWPRYSITSDTISIFRKADLHQEDLLLSKTPTLDVDGLTRFFSINQLHYVTEYNQVTAVGLFKSKVKTHLLLLANRGSHDFDDLKNTMVALAPEYSGKFLFVLVDGAVKSNAHSLEYFGLKPKQLPRVGIYDQTLDRSWLLPPGEITSERVKGFCNSFLQGALQKQSDDEKKRDSRTEL